MRNRHIGDSLDLAKRLVLDLLKTLGSSVLVAPLSCSASLRRRPLQSRPGRGGTPCDLRTSSRPLQRPPPGIASSATRGPVPLGRVRGSVTGPDTGLCRTREDRPNTCQSGNSAWSPESHRLGSSTITSPPTLSPTKRLCNSPVEPSSTTSEGSPRSLRAGSACPVALDVLVDCLNPDRIPLPTCA